MWIGRKVLAMFRDLAIGLVLVVSSTFAVTQQPPATPSADASSTTLYVECGDSPKAKRVLSPISASPGERWRAYVEVEIPNEAECLHTTRLWISEANRPFRVLYLMPPKRDAIANGMEILGWAKRPA